MVMDHSSLLSSLSLHNSRRSMTTAADEEVEEDHRLHRSPSTTTAMVTVSQPQQLTMMNLAQQQQQHLQQQQQQQQPQQRYPHSNHNNFASNDALLAFQSLLLATNNSSSFSGMTPQQQPPFDQQHQLQLLQQTLQGHLANNVMAVTHNLIPTHIQAALGLMSANNSHMNGNISAFPAALHGTPGYPPALIAPSLLAAVTNSLVSSSNINGVSGPSAISSSLNGDGGGLISQEQQHQQLQQLQQLQLHAQLQQLQQQLQQQVQQQQQPPALVMEDLPLPPAALPLSSSSTSTTFSLSSSTNAMTATTAIAPSAATITAAAAAAITAAAAATAPATPIYNGVNPHYPGLRVLHTAPPMFAVDHFLSPAECDFLIHAAADSFGPAPVVGRGAGEVSPSRTSSTCYLAREDLPDLLRKVSLLTGKPIDHCELPQVGRYFPTQQYLQHYDAFDLTNEDGIRFASNGGQRTITVLIYLNDVARGGATRFPAIPLEVQPVRGMALVFFPATVDGRLDHMALHAAMPAIDTKYVSQIWIRQGIYQGQPSKRLPQTLGIPFGYEQEHGVSATTMMKTTTTTTAAMTASASSPPPPPPATTMASAAALAASMMLVNHPHASTTTHVALQQQQQQQPDLAAVMGLSQDMMATALTNAQHRY